MQYTAYAGQPLGVVLAATLSDAQRAARAVRVEYGGPDPCTVDTNGGRPLLTIEVRDGYDGNDHVCECMPTMSTCKTGWVGERCD